MRRLSILFLVSLAAVAGYACSSATPPADDATTQADGDTCPVLDPGPPPTCPEGCVWNGQECRKNSSIVMPDLRPDAGKPPTN